MDNNINEHKNASQQLIDNKRDEKEYKLREIEVCRDMVEKLQNFIAQNFQEEERRQFIEEGKNKFYPAGSHIQNLWDKLEMHKTECESKIEDLKREVADLNDKIMEEQERHDKSFPAEAPDEWDEENPLT